MCSVRDVMYIGETHEGGKIGHEEKERARS